jgi:predicted ATP-grasp superfamily ATP-dependent carboligase
VFAALPLRQCLLTESAGRRERETNKTNMIDGPRAVVVGAALNGLGVVRSLARGGVPTIVMDTTYRRAAMWSRFAQPVIVEKLYGRKLVDGLMALQRGLDHRPVLLLADEMAVHTVSEHHEELKRAYQFQFPSRETVKVLENKARFHEFAEWHGLPVPRSIVISSVSDLQRLCDLRFPVIIKPANKRLVYLRRTQRLHMPADFEEARELCYTLLQTAGEFVVQEWIEGPTSSICFCLFYRGADRARTIYFSGRKILSHPPKAGSTAVCIAAPEIAEQLESFTAAFLELCDYRGLGSLEFKWDPTRRTFVVIEPTVGRTDWQEEVATLNGANIPLFAYRDLTGLSNDQPLLPPQPVAWRESWHRWSGRSALQADLPLYDGYWRLGDPLPSLAHYATEAARVAGEMTRRLFTATAAKRRQSVARGKQL